MPIAWHASPTKMVSLGRSLKTSDLFVTALENEGVEYIFAVPGAIISVAIALFLPLCEHWKVTECRQCTGLWI